MLSLLAASLLGSLTVEIIVHGRGGYRVDKITYHKHTLDHCQPQCFSQRIPPIKRSHGVQDDARMRNPRLMSLIREAAERLVWKAQVPLLFDSSQVLMVHRGPRWNDSGSHSSRRGKRGCTTSSPHVSVADSCYGGREPFPARFHYWRQPRKCLVPGWLVWLVRSRLFRQRRTPPYRCCYRQRPAWNSGWVLRCNLPAS